MPCTGSVSFSAASTRMHSMAGRVSHNRTRFVREHASFTRFQLGARFFSRSTRFSFLVVHRSMEGCLSFFLDSPGFSSSESVVGVLCWHQVCRISAIGIGCWDHRAKNEALRFRTMVSSAKDSLLLLDVSARKAFAKKKIHERSL